MIPEIINNEINWIKLNNINEQLHYTNGYNLYYKIGNRQSVQPITLQFYSLTNNWIYYHLFTNLSVITQYNFNDINAINTTTTATTSLYLVLYERLIGSYNISLEINSKDITFTFEIKYLLVTISDNNNPKENIVFNLATQHFYYSIVPNKYELLYMMNNNQLMQNTTIPYIHYLFKKNHVKDKKYIFPFHQNNILHFQKRKINNNYTSYYFVYYEYQNYFLENIAKLYELSDIFFNNSIQLLIHHHFISLINIEKNLHNLLQTIQLIWFPLKQKFFITILSSINKAISTSDIIVNKHRTQPLYKFTIKQTHYLYNNNNKTLYLLFQQHLNNQYINSSDNEIMHPIQFKQITLNLIRNDIIFESELNFDGILQKDIPNSSDYYINILNGSLRIINGSPSSLNIELLPHDLNQNQSITQLINKNILYYHNKNEIDKSQMNFFIYKILINKSWVVTHIEDNANSPNDIVQYKYLHRLISSEENITNLQRQHQFQYQTIFNQLQRLSNILLKRTTTTKKRVK